jgi:hypothetical protein
MWYYLKRVLLNKEAGEKPMHENEEMEERRREYSEHEVRERLIDIENLLRKLFNRLFPSPKLTSIKGELNMLVVNPGEAGIVFTVTCLDQNGKPFIPKNPITFVSDNPAVATVDSSQKINNNDGTVTIPVVAVSDNADGTPGIAHISGTENDSGNKLTATDELDVTVQAPPVPVLSSITGKLSVTPTQAATTNVSKNPLALS